MAIESIRLTRLELYDRVWSEPVWTLAPTLGLSDVGLKKMCSRMHIPTPYRGYWQKKAAGHTPKRTPLPKVAPSAVPSVLEATFGQSNQELRSPEAQGPVAEQRRYEANADHRITVAQQLVDPHPLVAKTVQALRTAKGDERGVLRARQSCLAVNVSIATADRAMSIYDALLKALDARGFPTAVRVGEGAGTFVSVGDERIGISLDEEINRTERKPRDPWVFAQYDYNSSAKLTLRLVDSWLRVRRTWADGARQRVEDCLNDFIVGLVAAAEAIKANRLERESWERERRAAEERRQVEERNREEEAGRVRSLELGVALWRKNRAAREFLADMRRAAEQAGVLTNDSPLVAWLAWADAYVDRTDLVHPAPRVPPDPEANRRDPYYLPSSFDDVRTRGA